MVDFSRQHRANRDRSFAVGGRATSTNGFMGRREAILVVAVVAMAALVVALVWPAGDSEPATGTTPRGGALPAMRYLDTAALPVPEPAGDAAVLAWWQDNPQAIHFDALDGNTWAWAVDQARRDQQRPPVPRFLDGPDLAGAGLRHGTALLVGGRVLERVPVASVDTAAWLVVEIAPSQYLLALDLDREVDAGEGASVRLVGRHLGTHPLAADGGGQQPAKVVSAHRVVVAEGDEAVSVTSLLDLGQAEDLGSGAWRPDPSVYEQIDDITPQLELRAYFQLLGQVLADSHHDDLYAGATRATDLNQRLHLDPAAYRGAICEITGTCVEAWDDRRIAADHPFGIERVVRMWLWAVAPHQTRNETGDLVEGTSLTLFEVAAIAPADAPLPGKGDRVTARGRFLKVLGYRLESDIADRLQGRQVVERLSDNTYFKFFVSDGFTAVPPPRPVSLLVIEVFVLVLFVSLIVVSLVWMGRERRHQDDYKRPLKRLRRTRRELAARGRGKPAEQPDPSDGVAGGEAQGTEGDADGDP